MPLRLLLLVVAATLLGGALLVACVDLSAAGEPEEPPTGRCGDDLTEGTEACDDGPRNGTPRAGCSSSCEVHVCGDGVPEGDEACDEGDAARSSSCDEACQLRCGNGVLEEGEECDLARVGACTPDCRVPAPAVCGDGLVGLLEACEPPADALPGFSECRDCLYPGCGDGTRSSGEPCDGGAGCSALCRLERSCGAVLISAGWSGNLVLDQDGGRHGFGADQRGQLGGEAPVDARPTPQLLGGPRLAKLSVGETASAGLTFDGRVVTFGSNDFGQRGVGPGEPGEAPSELALPVAAVDLAVGELTTWVVGQDGSLSSFGGDFSGALGLSQERLDGGLRELCGANPCVATAVGLDTPGVRFIAVDGFARTAAALDDGGTLWGWGNAAQGQLGPASPTALVGPDGRYEPVPIVVALGVESFSVGAQALDFISEGRLHGLGYRHASGVGAETTISEVAEEVILPAALSPGRFVGVSLGAAHGLAWLEDGRLLGFGGNSYGQLGLDQTDSLYGRALTPIETGASGVRGAEASWAHSIVLLDDGSVLTAGLAADGRLGRLAQTSAARLLPLNLCP